MGGQVPTQVESSAGKHRKRLVIVLAVTSTYLVVEVIAGLITRSLALIADAGHMLTDVIGLGLALFAIWFGGRAATPQRTYGYYRAEILAATVNALILFGISGYILFEAWKRFTALSATAARDADLAKIRNCPSLSSSSVPIHGRTDA